VEARRSASLCFLRSFNYHPHLLLYLSNHRVDRHSIHAYKVVESSLLMSGKTLLDQIDDLSEDDGDFIPASKRRRSSSGSSSSGSENDDLNPTKKVKTSEEEEKEKEAAAEAQKRKKAQRERDLNSIFDVEEEARAEREAGLLGRVVEDELVEVRRPRLFAGETIL
jgi:hypothetical protein